MNAGHPPPFQLRNGNGRLVDIEADPPLGITDPGYATHVVQLEPGDRLLFVTDGFLERNAVGVDIQTTLEATATRHPREIVRELAVNVLHAPGENCGTMPRSFALTGTDRRAAETQPRARARHGPRTRSHTVLSGAHSRLASGAVKSRGSTSSHGPFQFRAVSDVLRLSCSKMWSDHCDPPPGADVQASVRGGRWLGRPHARSP